MLGFSCFPLKPSPCLQKCVISMSRQQKKKESYLKAPTVADGLNTISAPLIPYIIQFKG